MNKHLKADPITKPTVNRRTTVFYPKILIVEDGAMEKTDYVNAIWKRVKNDSSEISIKLDNIRITSSKTESLRSIFREEGRFDNAVNFLQKKDYKKCWGYGLDLLILDIGLPDGNGLDILQEIRANTENSMYRRLFLDNTVVLIISGLMIGEDQPEYQVISQNEAIYIDKNKLFPPGKNNYARAAKLISGCLKIIKSYKEADKLQLSLINQKIRTIYNAVVH